MARVNGCLYWMPALRQAQGERKEGWSRGGPINPLTGSGRMEKRFAPWRAQRPFDRLRANGKEVRAMEGPSTLRQAQGERKRGSRNGGPFDPSTSSGRTEKRFAPWRAQRPFDRLRANGKKVRAKEGPTTLRQAQGERKRGFASWRAHRPFDRLRANGKSGVLVRFPIASRVLGLHRRSSDCASF